MLFRRTREDEIVAIEGGRVACDVHEWVLSLPWVVERPFSLETPGVRCFAVDCEPLDRRQMWLVTGLESYGRSGNPRVTVLVPGDAANQIERAGQGRTVAPMPSGHVLLTLDDSVGQRQHELEALLLTAYCYAMS
jgi:hypothetical protein